MRYELKLVGKKVSDEIGRQDRMYGQFNAANNQVVRFGIALLWDELAEAQLAWEAGRVKGDSRGDMSDVRFELIEIAALAMRLARDIDADDVVPGQMGVTAP